MIDHLAGQLSGLHGNNHLYAIPVPVQSRVKSLVRATGTPTGRFPGVAPSPTLKSSRRLSTTDNSLAARYSINRD
jgi:hypothetical protein